MLIVDSQIHLWQNGKMSAHHRQIPTYSVDDALPEMASAGVTEELPWLKGRDLERVMGGAVVDWLGWKRPAAA